MSDGYEIPSDCAQLDDCGVKQLIYLDFDGERTVYRNQDLGIVLDVEIENSGMTEKQKRYILSGLSEKYAGSGLFFTTEKPDDATEYSTVFIGQTDAFREYGDFAGLAETIDKGNQIRNDNAFVLADAQTDPDQVISVIDHELGHIVSGREHEFQVDGLKDYAATLISTQTATLTVKVSRSGGSSPGSAIAEKKYWTPSMPAGATYASITITNKGQTSSTRYEKAKIGITVIHNGVSYLINPNDSKTFTVYSNSTFTITRDAYLELEVSGQNYTSRYVGGAVGYHYSFSGYSYYSGSSTNTVSITADYYSDSDINQKPNNNPTTKPSKITGTVGISAGQTSSGLAVYSGGRLNVSSGGTANSTTIYSSGAMHVSRGGVANSTTVNSGGRLNVSSGGIANSATVSLGHVYVSSGGTANYTSLFSSWMYVSSGGTANHTLLKGGNKTSYSTTTIYRALAHIFRGGVANSTTIYSSGRLNVSSGGVANSTTLSGGELVVSSGGKANDTRVYSGGQFSVLSSGGVANSTTIYSSGVLSVSSGGVANSTTLSGGYLQVSNAGGVRNINGSGRIDVFSGGVASNLTLSGGYLFVFGGGTMRGLNASSVQTLYVSSGGKVTARTRFYSGATVSMGTGGIVDFDLTMMKSAGDSVLTNNLAAFKGTPVYTLTVNGTQSGTYKLAEGATGFDKTISVFNSGKNVGTLKLNSTVTISGKAYLLKLSGSNLTVTVGDPGKITSTPTGAIGISAGQVSTGLAVSSGGRINVSSGGTANKATLGASGVMHVSKGGITNSATLSGGSMHVSTGGVVKNTKGSGLVYISSGGVASNLTLSGGGLYVLNGGTVRGLNVSSLQKLYVSSGGKISARTRFYNGACVSMGTSGVVDFDLTIMTSAGDSVLTNNLAAFKGAPVYTIKVNGKQSGTYKLAEGASGFNKTISVFNSSGKNIGTLKLNSTSTIDGKTYLLKLSGSNLTVTVGDKGASTPASTGAKSIGISAGKVSTGLAVSSGGRINVFSGGTANSTTVNSSGAMHVSKGGVTNHATVNSMGGMHVSSGGIANFATVNSYGSMHVSSGGTANHATVNSMGGMHVFSGGTANFASINSYGSMHVSSGGIANSTTVNDWGIMYISSGGTANYTTVNPWADLYVYSGGTVNSTTLSSGWMYISGGVAKNTRGTGTYTYIYVYSGGVASNLTMSSGTLSVHSGGTIRGLNASSVQTLNISSGGKITARTRFYNGATVSVGSGGTVDFDLTMMKSAGDSVLTNNLAAFKGSPVYTLTVNGTQSGTYRLAEGASGFNKTISVFNSDKKVGTLKLNTTVTISGKTYLLKLSGGNLTVTVGDAVKSVQNSSMLVKNDSAILSAGDDQNILNEPASAVDWKVAGTGDKSEWEQISTGDFNGDGKCDMLWKNSFVGEGGLTYNAYCTWIVEDPVDWRMVSVADPAEWNFLCSGDFNGDKMNDIAMINGEGVVGIWGVSDGYLSSWSILSAVTPEWQLAGVADFNADGTDDIAWSNVDTGLTGYWQIENKELAGWQTIANLV